MLLVYAVELEEVSVMEAEMLEEVESVTKSEVVEEVESVTGSEGREGELEPGNVQKGSPAVAGALVDEVATLRNAAVAGDGDAEASECACLASWEQL